VIFIDLGYTAADDPQDSDFDPTDGASSRGGIHVSAINISCLYALIRSCLYST
jgi:hypothetical protein